MAKEELVKAAGTAVGAAISFEDDAGKGFENADSAAYAIPFISILQSGSPQCKKSDGKYIKGAEEGHLFNTVSEEVLDGQEGIVVVPCHYDRAFLEFGDRDAGDTGFYGAHGPTSDRVLNTPVASDGKRAGKQVTQEGHILTDTRQHYVLVVKPDGTFTPAVIGMSSTQVKASRTWMSKMDGIKMKRADGSMFTPPMFSHSYKLSTIAQSNDQGAWMGWKIELLGPVEDASIYQAAKAFRDAVRAGEVKVKHEGQDTDDSEEPIPF
jgi:hypothetical protein